MAVIFIAGFASGLLLDYMGTLLFAVSHRFWYFRDVSRAASELAGTVNELADLVEFTLNGLLMPLIAFALLLTLWRRTKRR